MSLLHRLVGSSLEFVLSTHAPPAGEVGRVPGALLSGRIAELAIAFLLPRRAFKLPPPFAGVLAETLGRARGGCWGLHTLRVLDTPTKIALGGVYGTCSGCTADAMKTCLLRVSHPPESAEDLQVHQNLNLKSEATTNLHAQMPWQCTFKRKFPW